MASATDQKPADRPDSRQQGKPEGQEPPKSAGTPFYKKPLGKVLITVVVIAAVIGGSAYYVYSHGHESTDDAFIDGHIIAISPQVAGKVLGVYVNDNQPVKKGELLVKIDPQDFEVRLAQARAALQAALVRERSARISVKLASGTTTAGMQQATSALQANTAGVQTTREQVAAARSRLGQASAELAAARANDVRAQADARRYQELFAQGVIPRQQLDAARAAALAGAAQVRNAQAAVLAARDTLGQAESQVQEARARILDAEGRLTAARTGPYQVQSSQAQVESSHADVLQARANLKQAELQLAYTRIKAPDSGRVTHKTVEAGAYVQVGQPLLAIVRPDVWVTANFKETQLTRMQRGQPVQIHVDAYPGRTFAGHVDSIQPGSGARFSLLPPENATGNFVKVVQRVPVKIVFDEPPEAHPLLTPGMSVEPVVELK